MWDTVALVPGAGLPQVYSCFEPATFRRHLDPSPVSVVSLEGWNGCALYGAHLQRLRPDSLGRNSEALPG